MFNVNELAEGHSYYNLNGINVSPDNKWVAFGVDTVSRRKYTIYIKNLESGDILEESIPLTTGGSTWANDSNTLFYTKKDEQTLRSDRIFRHTKGTDVSSDVLIFTEEDETFGTYVYKTKSDKFLVIGSYSTLTSEFQVLDANNPMGTFKVFQPRTRGLEYSIAHFENDFYIPCSSGYNIDFEFLCQTLIFVV